MDNDNMEKDDIYNIFNEKNKEKQIQKKFHYLLLQIPKKHNQITT